jgi:uncharacterized protein (TIGR03437 family)
LSPTTGADGKVATSLGGTEVLVNNIKAPILFSEGRSIGLAPTAPGFYTQNNQGTGEVVALHQDGVTPVTRLNPAKRNEVVVLHLTGLGVLNPVVGTGVPAGANPVVAPVTLMFGTANGTVEYAGAVLGNVGRNQINARIPAGAPSGDVPVSITVGGRAANPVTIAIAP